MNNNTSVINHFGMFSGYSTSGGHKKNKKLNNSTKNQNYFFANGFPTTMITSNGSSKQQQQQQQVRNTNTTSTRTVGGAGADTGSTDTDTDHYLHLMNIVKQSNLLDIELYKFATKLIYLNCQFLSMVL